LRLRKEEEKKNLRNRAETFHETPTRDDENSPTRSAFRALKVVSSIFESIARIARLQKRAHREKKKMHARRRERICASLFHSPPPAHKCLTFLFISRRRRSGRSGGKKENRERITPSVASPLSKEREIKRTFKKSVCVSYPSFALGGFCVLKRGNYEHFSRTNRTKKGGVVAFQKKKERKKESRRVISHRNAVARGALVWFSRPLIIFFLVASSSCLELCPFFRCCCCCKL
jgi:hypothetical protein